MAKSTKDCWQKQEAERGKKVLFPTAFRERAALLTTWFQTFSLQDCETIPYVKLLICGSLSWKPSGNSIGDLKCHNYADYLPHRALPQPGFLVTPLCLHLTPGAPPGECCWYLSPQAPTLKTLGSAVFIVSPLTFPIRTVVETTSLTCIHLTLANFPWDRCNNLMFPFAFSFT